MAGEYEPEPNTQIGAGGDRWPTGTAPTTNPNPPFDGYVLTWDDDLYGPRGGAAWMPNAGGGAFDDTMWEQIGQMQSLNAAIPAEEFYSVPGFSINGSGVSAAVNAGNVYYEPIYVFTPIRITDIACAVAGTPVGNLMRLGIVRSDETYQPDPNGLLFDGQVSVSSQGLKQISGLSVDLQPGMHLAAFTLDANTSLRYQRGSHEGSPMQIRVNAGGQVVNSFFVAGGNPAVPFTDPMPNWTTPTQSGTQTHVVAFRWTAIP